LGSLAEVLAALFEVVGADVVQAPRVRTSAAIMGDFMGAFLGVR
jgi:hypothetical protein